MGPDMRIMSGSYRDQRPFARPICDLAFAIASANPSWNRKTGPSGHIPMRTGSCPGQEFASFQVESMGFPPLPHHIFSGVLASLILRTLDAHPEPHVVGCRAAKNVNN